MMKTRLVCLANSYKEGGRCLAGVEMEDGLPLFNNEKPVWIRPVCKTKHGEIPTYLVPHIKLLDLVELDVLEKVPAGYQSENVLFDPKSLKIVGNHPSERLPALCCDRQPHLFGCHKKAVDEAQAQTLDHSLTMVQVSQARFYKRGYADTEKAQVRTVFAFGGHEYDLPVTDPVFLDYFKRDQNLAARAERIFLVLSLGILHEGLHYKLAAGVIYW